VEDLVFNFQIVLPQLMELYYQVTGTEGQDQSK